MYLCAYTYTFIHMYVCMWIVSGQLTLIASFPVFCVGRFKLPAPIEIQGCDSPPVAHCKDSSCFSLWGHVARLHHTVAGNLNRQHKCSIEFIVYLRKPRARLQLPHSHISSRLFKCQREISGAKACASHIGWADLEEPQPIE